MVATARLTTVSESSALAFDRATIWPASSARATELFTVAVISSRAAAVSSTEAACCSVRMERLAAAALSSPADASMLKAFSPTFRSAVLRVATEALKSSRS